MKGCKYLFSTNHWHDDWILRQSFNFSSKGQNLNDLSIGDPTVKPYRINGRDSQKSKWPSSRPKILQPKWQLHRKSKAPLWKHEWLKGVSIECLNDASYSIKWCHVSKSIMNLQILGDMATLSPMTTSRLLRRSQDVGGKCCMTYQLDSPCHTM